MKENIEEFYDFGYGVEIDKSFDITAWSETDVKGLLSLDEEGFKYYLQRAGKQAVLMRWKKAFNTNIFEEFGEITFTTIGLYLFLKLNTNLKSNNFEKYVSYFQELAIDDLLRYHGLKSNQKKSKKSNSTYNFEEKGEYESKKISDELKITDLDIEDKSHLFYDKKVLITGTFKNFEIRDDMSKLIKSVGGHNKTSIAKSLDYVVVGENAGPSKLIKIKDWNLKTLNEEEFLKLFK